MVDVVWAQKRRLAPTDLVHQTVIPDYYYDAAGTWPLASSMVSARLAKEAGCLLMHDCRSVNWEIQSTSCMPTPS